MSEFYGVFEYWSQYRVLYCPTCRYCPIPHIVETHLRKLYPQIPVGTRKKIVLAVEVHTEVARCPSDVIYPEPHTLPVHGLLVEDNALACYSTQDDG